MDMITESGLLHRIMRTIEKTTREKADIVVSLSEDMKHTIEKLANKPCGQYVTLNNFLLDSFEKKDTRSLSLSAENVFSSEDSVKLIFAGNLGQFQGLENVVEAVLSMHEDSFSRIEVVFVGEGKALASLKEQAKEGDHVKSSH